VNAWLGDPRAFFDATRPAFAAAKARSFTQLRSLEDDPAQGLPWALTLVASLPLALLVGVPTAGVGIGVLLGLMIAAGVTLYWRARARECATALAHAIAGAHVDADQRVALVTRQYEWAVNDIANLRDALRRARAQSAAQGGPGPTQTVPLARRLSDTDPTTTLRFAARGIVPEQVRILDNGTVVAISARALETAPDADAAFTIRVSEYVAAALTSGESRLVIEALIDERWLPVELRPADALEVRTTEIRDKRGRAYRVPIEDRPFAVIALPLAQTS
jgi:hypothetical protein